VNYTNMSSKKRTLPAASRATEPNDAAESGKSNHRTPKKSESEMDIYRDIYFEWRGDVGLDSSKDSSLNKSDLEDFDFGEDALLFVPDANTSQLSPGGVNKPMRPVDEGHRNNKVLLSETLQAVNQKLTDATRSSTMRNPKMSPPSSIADTHSAYSIAHAPIASLPSSGTCTPTDLPDTNSPICTPFVTPTVPKPALSNASLPPSDFLMYSYVALPVRRSPTPFPFQPFRPSCRKLEFERKPCP